MGPHGVTFGLALAGTRHQSTETYTFNCLFSGLDIASLQSAAKAPLHAIFVTIVCLDDDAENNRLDTVQDEQYPDNLACATIRVWI